jgi:3-hydroxyisobutyrate dehydrogenase-like beta-hydroxyacid dehydrogenase
MDQVVGMIGLGAMGLPIALRLARAGFRLAVFDVNAAAVD